MHRDSGGGIRYSPTDLLVWRESPFASWMDRWLLENPGKARPEEDDDEDRILAERGLRHERAFLDALRAGGADVAEIPTEGDRLRLTRDAMAAGREWVYQAALEAPPFGGYADFLKRVEGPSRLGAFHYEPWDTKLARSPRPGYAVQLCAYAAMLEAAQGVRPARVHVALGSGETRSLRTDDYHYYARRLQRAFLEFHEAFDPTRRPEPEVGRDHGRWQALADRFFEESDHVGRVAGITRLQARRLGAAGIRTLEDLATTRLDRVPRMAAPTFERLRRQARLQRLSRGKDAPEVEVLPSPGEGVRQGLSLLPPPRPLDVFFDMEGYPYEEGGLEYLFGATHLEGRDLGYRDWWAHDAAGEKAALEGFVDWVHARWREDRSMHVYHYASYEVTALRRLMGRYGTREDEVDDLLRHEVFVDLYAVVRHGVQVGTPSYSIKALEPLYQGRRTGEVVSGGQSIVEYHRWRESGEPRDARASPRLAAIRAYNREDCDSMVRLAEWLRGLQARHGIAWTPPRAREEAEEPAPKKASALARRALALELLAEVPADAADRAREAERWEVQETLAHLLEFHRREEKPMWWALFDRAAMTPQELVEDLDCLGALERESRPPVPLKRSRAWWYRYDPDQDTKLDAGSKCFLAPDRSVRAEILEMDREEGRVLLKFGPKCLALLPGAEPPARTSLVPDEYVNAEPIAEGIHAVARAWRERRELPPALADFLGRRRPRVRGAASGALVRPGEDAQAACVRMAPLLDGTALCIQGPPGSGKTHTAAEMIRALVAGGKRVGVTANSHAAVLNVLKKCAELSGGDFPFLKVGGPDEDEVFRTCRGARWVAETGDGVERRREAPVIGGTAWLFARPEMAGDLDTLFVDEAGQVSVANLVGTSRAARNLVLIGDQMQLGQPIQGTHPGRSGLSVLEHYLGDHVTVPAELGVFLDRTRRLHPRLCSFVSGAFYEDRLRPADGNEKRVVRVPGRPGSVPLEAGLLFVGVEHEGNSQASDEEVERVRSLVADLVGRPLTDRDANVAGSLDLSSLLFVAPYNMQVRQLRRALGRGARVASVDKFQGQEAPVVVVSMCASEGDGSPRGLEFLLHRNRLNVAISRAWALAIVVGHPRLGETRCSTLEQVRLCNTFCRILDVGTPL